MPPAAAVSIPWRNKASSLSIAPIAARAPAAVTTKLRDFTAFTNPLTSQSPLRSEGCEDDSPHRGILRGVDDGVLHGIVLRVVLVEVDRPVVLDAKLEVLLRSGRPVHRVRALWDRVWEPRALVAFGRLGGWVTDLDLRVGVLSSKPFAFGEC